MVESSDEEISSRIKDLELVKSLGNLNFKKIPLDLFDRLQNKESKEYIQGLPISKPEAILCDKFFLPIMNDIVSNFPQARAGSGGWVDYMIPQSGESLPIAIEVKSLHTSSGRLNPLSNELREMKVELENSKWNQVVRYLVGAEAFAYVILTNLDDVYYFNREAVKDFRPFFTEKFPQFIESLRLTGNVWDIANRRDESIPRKDLTNLFFNDLKTWYQWLKEIKWLKDSDESSVFLINKLIFALTLEDIGVIRFKHVLREYERSKTLYDRKGPKAVLTDFFKSIDEFLYRYYDTELFSESNNILKKILDDRANLNSFKNVIEKLLGYSASASAFISGLYSYNYRFIDEDVFGKSYETFLAEEKKDQGIFYTPRKITAHMSSELVTHLFKHKVDEIIAKIDKGDLEEAKEGVESLSEIKIMDPACGSGPFLVGCLRNIFEEYKRMEQKTSWADRFNGSTLSEPEEMKEKREKTYEIRELLGFQKGFRDNTNYRVLISKIIFSHLFGIDLDEKAVDVAKVNIWKEAIKLHPRSFVYEQLPEDESHILPDLRINFVKGDSIVGPDNEEVADLLSSDYKKEIAQLLKFRTEYGNNPTNPELIENIVKIKNVVKEKLSAKYEEFLKRNSVLFPLEFFNAFFDSNGDKLSSEEKGFSGVIGNPPWNDVEAIKKEFAQKHPDIFGEGISKFSTSSKEFEPVFDEKLKDPRAKELWGKYSDEIHFLSEFIRKNYKLHYKGGVTLQKAFLEKFIDLTNDSFAVLVPSNFHTDEGTYKLRQKILEELQLKELISFENRKKNWFPDIDSRFKFDMLFVTIRRTGKPFQSRFYVNDWDDANKTFEYPVGLIQKLSPKVLGITEFRSERDIEIVKKIRDNHPLLFETGARISNELHRTLDKDIFHTSETKDSLVVYEGKMINQYTSHFSEGNYWVNEEDGRKRLLNAQAMSIMGYLARVEGSQFDKKEIISLLMNKKFHFDYEENRLAFRVIGRSTDARSLIACIMPERSFMVHSLAYLDPFDYHAKDDRIKQISKGDFKYFLLALFNSFTIDYFIRLRISANLTFPFIYELPIPRPSEEIETKVVARAKELTEDPSDRLKRAELEILIGKELYRLDKEDMEHILDSFVYGNVDEELIKLIRDKYGEPE